MIRTFTIAATLTGGNGAAGGNADTVIPVNGKLIAVYIDVATGSQPNTVDVTVATKGKNAPAQTLLTATNVSTSAWYYPTVAVQDATGAAATYDGTHGIREKFPIDDYVNAAAVQGNAGALNVYLLVDA